MQCVKRRINILVKVRRIKDDGAGSKYDSKEQQEL